MPLRVFLSSLVLYWAFIVLIIVRDLLLVSFDDWHGYC